MKLSDLEFAPAYTLPASLALFRVQRFTHRQGDKKVGRIRLAPPGTLKGRFDLAEALAGYFAERPETAGYECLARREVDAIPFDLLTRLELVCFTVSRPIQLLDLRVHAQSFPVLQSLRFRLTQQLAASIWAVGFGGIIYKSAQQFGMDCMVIFGPNLKLLKHAWSERLVQAGTGNLHQLIAELKRGAQIEFLPPA